MKGRPWTRGELLRVLALYCEIPFGQMHSRNQKVISLAESIERTPSSVALKLVNFASFDRGHQVRGVAGMGNTSKLDREIWNEVQADWSLIVDVSISENSGIDVEEKTWGRETSAMAITRVRRGQQFFRLCVLSAYDFRCALTGIKSLALLRASHIIPWHKREKTRVEPRNGVCLNALHDAAFDRGLVTFDKELRLVLSSRLKGEMPSQVFGEMFKTYEGRRLNSPQRFAPLHEYFEFHRTVVFNKNP